MAFPIPVFTSPVIFLKEGITYIVPESDAGPTATFDLYRKVPDVKNPTSLRTLNKGDTITFTRPRNGIVFVAVRVSSSGLYEYNEYSDKDGSEFILWDNDAFTFTDKLQANGLIGRTYWGKISQSQPRGFIRNANEGITTLINRVTGAASDCSQTSNFKPVFVELTASKSPGQPVTASRFTSGITALSYSGGGLSEYISSNGYQVVGVFHVTSMSNGATDSIADNYQLFSDGSSKSFGIHFRTSSQSGFSPDDQFVDVVLTHNATTLTHTASMNALHTFRASFNSASSGGTVSFQVDESAPSTETPVTPIDSLATAELLLGTTVVPIGSGSTTVVTSSVTSSADLVEIAFANTQSSEGVVDAIKNHHQAVYRFGEPIAFKTPAYISNIKFWGRMSPGNFVVENNTEVTKLVNKLGNGIGDIETIINDDNLVLTTVDVDKPLSGANLSGSAGSSPGLGSSDNINLLVSNTRYQVYAVLKTNNIATNITTSNSLNSNEQILADESQNWGLYLRQGSGSSDGNIIAWHVDKTPTTMSLSSSITLNQIYLVDWLYDGTTMRLQINNDTAISTSGGDNVDTLTSAPLYLGDPVNTFASAANVDTDILELATGDQAVEDETDRTLFKKYIFDRYSILEQVVTQSTMLLPSFLTGTTMWARPDNAVTASAEGVPNLHLYSANKATDSEFSIYFATGAFGTLDIQNHPMVTTVSGVEAYTFNVDNIDNAKDLDDELYFRKNAINPALGSTDLLGSSLTNWHFFMVFHVTASFSPNGFYLNSSNVFENHRIAGMSNANRWWGVYGRTEGGTQQITPYLFDSAQRFTSHSIGLGQIHLLEFWHTGSFMYSMLDNGPILSSSAGTIGSGGTIYLGGEDPQELTGSIMEAVFCSASNRIGTGSNNTVEYVRNYFSNRYGISV
jgi:hypothetical protein